MPVYSFECVECGGWEGYIPFYSSPNPPCPKCTGEKVERVFKVTKHIAASAFPYTTKNIHPEGREIEVRSSAHLEELCKRYGKTHRPDAAWLTKEYHGWDPFKKKQIYSEGSGLGMPGCWV